MALDQLAARLTELGSRRVLVLSAPSRWHVDRVLGSIAQFTPAVFDGAKVHGPRRGAVIGVITDD